MEYLRGQRILLQNLDFEIEMMRPLLPKIIEVQLFAAAILERQKNSHIKLGIHMKSQFCLLSCQSWQQ